MSNYGRNFEFRVPPDGKSRGGRYRTPAAGAIPIGAPVTVDLTAAKILDQSIVKLAAGSTDPVRVGVSGLMIYEYSAAYQAGHDPFLTTWSDYDTAPLNAACQVVADQEVVVLLRNTLARTFLNSRSYAPRTMVAGLDIATPTLAVGDLLRPHDTPNDTNGYWQETATAAEAWLVVLGIDASRHEVRAQMLFG